MGGWRGGGRLRLNKESDGKLAAIGKMLRPNEIAIGSCHQNHVIQFSDALKAGFTQCGKYICCDVLSFYWFRYPSFLFRVIAVHFLNESCDKSCRYHYKICIFFS